MSRKRIKSNHGFSLQKIRQLELERVEASLSQPPGAVSFVTSGDGTLGCLVFNTRMASESLDLNKIEGPSGVHPIGSTGWLTDHAYQLQFADALSPGATINLLAGSGAFSDATLGHVEAAVSSVTVVGF